MSANSSFQDSSGSKKPYLCRRGSSWYKQGRLGRPTMLIPRARPRRASDAYWWLQGWRRTISLCTQRSGCSQHLCNMAVCKCVLQRQQQTMKSAQQRCDTGEWAQTGGREICVRLRTFGQQAILAKRAPLLLWATITDFDSPLPTCRPLTGSRALPLVVSPSPSLTTAAGLWALGLLSAVFGCCPAVPCIHSWRRLSEN